MDAIAPCPNCSPTQHELFTRGRHSSEGLICISSTDQKSRSALRRLQVRGLVTPVAIKGVPGIQFWQLTEKGRRA